METISIAIVNPKAKNLLKDMEELELIKVLHPTNSNRPKASEILRGSISKIDADEFNNYVNESREEWERNI
jgi:hypothetical protein